MKTNLNTYNTNQELDTFQVPDGMWKEIEKVLDEKNGKKRALIYWLSGAAAVLLLAIGSTFLFYSNEVEVKHSTAVAKLKAKENKSGEQQESFFDCMDSAGIINPSEININDTIVEPGLTTNYTATVIDANGCTTLNNVTTTIPFTNITGLCGTDGTVNIIANGGTAPITYQWSNTAAASPTTDLTLSGAYSFTTTTNGNTLNFTSVNPTSQGMSNNNGGPVNVPTTGIINGVHVQEHIPTKRLIPYEHVKEADIQYRAVISEENIGRLNNKNEEYIEYLNGDLNSDWVYGSGETVNRSTYDPIYENNFLLTKTEPLSTFSIDVDGASYSDVRGMINRGQRPLSDAVRLEEFVNYFPYEYEEPQGEHPFSIETVKTNCPWNSQHQLLKIGIKGQSIDKAQLPSNNLVFLIDVSGSMNSPEKLELLKKGFRMLVNELRPEDRVAITVYAGAAGLVLPPTSGSEKDKIMDALNKLSAGGSTAGGQGIELAYATADKYFKSEGNNRVILATDGDFNVGISGDDALVELIEEKRKSGVFLTVLGFGHDNFQSSKMEKLANNGNGNFSFIDNILEAKKVLVTEMGATLKTIAKDVKIQMEFNPQHVKGYRLLGYENRLLANEDFSNDTIDAGELGAGHTVTAIYEIIPSDSQEELASRADDGLKYSSPDFTSKESFNDEFATVKFRYKQPDGTKSILIERTVSTTNSEANSDFEFIQAVVEFGLILRNSKYKGTASFDSIIEKASRSLGDDPFGYRHEFIALVEKTRLLFSGEELN